MFKFKEGQIVKLVSHSFMSYLKVGQEMRVANISEDSVQFRRLDDSSGTYENFRNLNDMNFEIVSA